MKFILDNSLAVENLYPFTLTRHAADIRIGILSLREKLIFNNNNEVFDSYEAYATKYPNTKKDFVQLPANAIPSQEQLQNVSTHADIDAITNLKILNRPWDIFLQNDWAIREDFKLITKGRKSQPISATNKIINEANIFLEEGVQMEHCILNASTGPIYIGKNALIMENAMIRGPFALCQSAVVKMGAKIYGATTIGPNCSIGGEIKNCVFFGYSNKAHDGYLGDSVIGEWCNLGALTSNSNIKNNAGEVQVWSQKDNNYIAAGIKCGLLMGDYSRCAINTLFNTGTVAGVSCNIFGNGLTPTHIPSFSWGNSNTLPYQLSKALQDIDNWKKLKGKAITEQEKNILTTIYNNHYEKK